MADRASASIRIGGAIQISCIPALIAALAADGARADWEGEELDESAVCDGAPLEAFACELPGGIFQDTESFCEAHRLAFVRSSGSCAGAFGAERVVFTGATPPDQFDLTEHDEVVLTRSGLRGLGSIEAAEHWFASAEFTPPPISIVEDDRASTPMSEVRHG